MSGDLSGLPKRLRTAYERGLSDGHGLGSEVADLQHWCKFHDFDPVEILTAMTRRLKSGRGRRGPNDGRRVAISVVLPVHRLANSLPAAFSAVMSGYLRIKGKKYAPK